MWQIRQMSYYVALFMMDNTKVLWFNLLLKFPLSYGSHTLQYCIIGNIIWYWYSTSKLQFSTNFYFICASELQRKIWYLPLCGCDTASVVNNWLILHSFYLIFIIFSHSTNTYIEFMRFIRKPGIKFQQLLVEFQYWCSVEITDPKSRSIVSAN